MSTRQASIERSITIQASAETVWGIVSEPGWWVNSGTLVEHRIEDCGDGVQVVHDRDHGAFTLTTVALDPPRYASFRWHPREPDEPATLTEFWIEDLPEGGVSLRVVESGFEGLPADELHAILTDNAQGWKLELDVVRSAVEKG
jgi:uncharacterized protein YndB with AHSA1/START domain